jgi:hypothetical protein
MKMGDIQPKMSKRKIARFGAKTGNRTVPGFFLAKKRHGQKKMPRKLLSPAKNDFGTSHLPTPHRHKVESGTIWPTTFCKRPTLMIILIFTLICLKHSIIFYVANYVRSYS